MILKKILPTAILTAFFIVMSGFEFLVTAYSYAEFEPSSFSAANEVVLVAWNSQEGLRRLTRTQYKEDFHQLAHTYQPQINPLYCGIASSVIILNALRLAPGLVPSQKPLEVNIPKVLGGGTIPFREYSQLTFLNKDTDKVKLRAIIDLENITQENTKDVSKFSPGLKLAELKGVLEVYDLVVEMSYADNDPKEGSAAFREDVKSILNQPKHFLVVNFVGKLIGAPTGGHISPVVAYDEQSDSVLLLDVAGHKNPWYWVPLEHLYQSMHTKDGDTYRGWITVKDSQSIPK